MLYCLGDACGFGVLSWSLFLAALGPVLAAALTWLLLPRLWAYLPRDHGKALAVDGAKSQGKPTGAGFIFILLFIGVCLLVLPPRPFLLESLACILFAMLTGFYDDASEVPWHEYKKAALDVLIVLLAALAFCQLKPVQWWFPFVKGSVSVPVWLFVPLAAALLWFVVNATNCTDGVDGLSGSLCSLAYLYLGALLLFIVGSSSAAASLGVPHDAHGAAWTIMAFTMCGTLAAYLWYNANPSLVLMGDAGSRAMGLLLGLLVLATGNPFIILAVAGVILVNGGAGLFKVSLKRFLNIEFLWSIRFPLHDHMRKNLNWSIPQVVARFVLIQALLLPLLLLLFIAVR